MTDLTLLEDTITVFGTDRTRWPEGRADALRYVCETAEGQALFTSERAFESMLDRAPSGGTDAALMARIMGATVDVAEAGRTENRSPQPVRRHERPAAASRETGWIAGGLMAASLMIGIFAGANGLGVGIGDDGLVFGSGVEAAQNDGPGDDSLIADLTLTSGIDLEDDIL